MKDNLNGEQTMAAGSLPFLEFLDKIGRDDILKSVAERVLERLTEFRNAQLNQATNLADNSSHLNAP